MARWLGTTSFQQNWVMGRFQKGYRGTSGKTRGKSHVCEPQPCAPPPSTGCPLTISPLTPMTGHRPTRHTDIHHRWVPIPHTEPATHPLAYNTPPPPLPPAPPTPAPVLQSPADGSALPTLPSPICSLGPTQGPAPPTAPRALNTLALRSTPQCPGLRAAPSPNPLPTLPASAPFRAQAWSYHSWLQTSPWVPLPSDTVQACSPAQEPPLCLLLLCSHGPHPHVYLKGGV